MNFVTSKDGTKIAYEKVGSGSPLVLVGGGLCDRKTSSCGTPLAALLASNFTVYCYDRRGRGDSGGGNTEPYSVQCEIDDLKALVAKIGEPVYLYGMSSGGFLSMKAIAAGLAVNKLVVYEPPFSTQSDEINQWKRYVIDVKKHIAKRQYSEAATLFMKTAGMPSFMVKIIKLTPIWKKVVKLAPTLAYDAEIVKDRVLPTKDWLVNIPTTVIDGGKSPVSLRESAKKLAQILPQAAYLTLLGQTHNVNPKPLALAITNSLK
ncbi:MAG TPA: alpha/beta hydrolase [Candidatus Saccharimonadales bacterium]|nr:alpha/beta hydrolase [Candidatus Saccharimonadales bacterium]